MNPSKRIQPSVGPHATKRKAPTRAIVAGHGDKKKGAAMTGAKKSVTKATFNHTAKAHQTSDLKGKGNC